VLLNNERQQLIGEAIGKKLADGNCNKNNIIGKKGGKVGKKSPWNCSSVVPVMSVNNFLFGLLLSWCEEVCIDGMLAKNCRWWKGEKPNIVRK
jgi:hypothetical protein